MSKTVKTPLAPQKKYTKDLKRHLTEKDGKMARKHKKRCSTSSVFKEMKIKITKYHYRSITMAKIKKTDHTKC